MPGPLGFVVILLAGAALGVVFFGGLWLTVRALPHSRHATLLALASYWGRTLLVVGGLLLAMDSSWQRALICLSGFTVARIGMARWAPAHPAAGRGAV